VLDKRSIELPKSHIKATGKHQVTVHLHPDVAAKFALEVVAAG
jgi:large subunit ribosomal protein L9